MMRILRGAVLAFVVLSLFAGGALGAQNAPQPGGTIVIALGSDPETLNPGITTEYASGAVAAQVYSGLVRFNGQGVMLPQLATSWEASPDGRQYTFHLRRGGLWHDGQPVSSADVKFSFEEVEGKYHGRFRLAFANIQAVDTPDAGTVVIRMKQPYAPFLKMLSVFDAPILPRHLFQDQDVPRSPRNLQPVGTGPFVFREWARGDRIVVERNARYWEPVYPDRLIFRILPNSPQRTTALDTGEVDAVPDFFLSKTDIPRLRRNNQVRIRYGQPIPAMDFMFMNTQHPALSNVKVRQALALAINRDQIVQQAMRGLARPAHGPFGDGFKFAYAKESDYAALYSYNPQKAQALLDEAGVRRGSLRLGFIYDASRAPHAAAGEIIRDNLRQVGVTVDLVPLERSVRLDRVYVKRDYDLSIESFTSNTDPAIGYHRIYLPAQPGQTLVNATGYSNPEVDRILAQAGQAANVQDRARLYAQVDAILARDIPTLILFDEIGVDAARTRLQNLWQGLDVRDAWYMVWVQQ